MNQTKILDVKIDIISKSQILEKIKDLLTPPNPPLSLKLPVASLNGGGHGKQLITTNPEFIIEAQKNQEFKNILNNSWLSVADGYGIRLAAKYQQLTINKKIKDKNSLFLIPYSLFLGLKVAWWGITKNNKKLDVITNVITGTDLIPEICKMMNYESRIKNYEKRIFLLGGYNNTSELTAKKLTKQFNNLTINYSVFEKDNIIEKINNFQPDILFVALNHPRAQIWINNNLEKMPSVKLAIGVGGAFDYISGKIKRAPQNWQSSYEWIYRLKKEPRRFKRIFNAVIKFPWLVFTKTICKK
ncbi:WecB/TagA/CpsF family glycosyltransferase [Patescibacteria group bacterium]|nr:WecB/TagA/CpsF family glycosyltransferase [Patescibacteria group bacterium]